MSVSTSRSVFKIFGSLGPAGSLVTMTEKACRSLFTEAYELGDPAQLVSKEEELLRQARSEFVNELFNFKSEFERKTASLKEEVRQEAYGKLGQIYETSKSKMIRLEKQRLQRERYYYQQEGNEVKYNQSLKKKDLVEGDVTDNLTKMIVQILKPDLEQMKILGYDANQDEEEGAIEERISQLRAEELLAEYKRLIVKLENAPALSGRSAMNEPLMDTRLADELFVTTGEDYDDIMAAFAHYKLNKEVSDDDRRRYA